MKSKIINTFKQFLILNFTLLTFFTSCSVQKQIAKSAKADVLDTKALQTAHVGISIFNPSTKKYLYNYQGDKYFVPASNTKLPTCYAAMKYLGDSLVGLRYKIFDETVGGPGMIIKETGDPTFLHLDFKNQPVLEFLRSSKMHISRKQSDFQESRLGSGWAWNDYEESYMAERSSFPIYGNVVRFAVSNNHIMVMPKYFQTAD